MWPHGLLKGAYYRQVVLMSRQQNATELDLAVAKEHVKMLENKIELLNYKLQGAVADSECRKRKYSAVGCWIGDMTMWILAGILAKKPSSRHTC